MLELNSAHSVKYLRLVHDVAGIVREAQTLDAGIGRVLRRLYELGIWSFVHCYRRRVTDDEVLFVPTGLWRGGTDGLDRLAEVTRATHFAVGEGVIGRVGETGRLRWVRDVRDELQELKRPLHDVGLRSGIILPVPLNDHVTAVLELYSTDPLSPADELGLALEAVGRQLGYLFARREMERYIADMSAEEQRRIGSELHDSVGQQITAMGFLAKNLQRRLEADERPEAEAAAALAASMEEAKGQLRAIIHGLAPVGVDPGTLSDALENLARHCEATYPIEVRFRAALEQPVPDSFTATHLYRIAQEAIQNCVKHGNADRITIDLHNANGRTTLKIRDDGVGFDPALHGRAGLGMRIMNHRAALIGGRLRIVSAEEKGTLVICTVREEEG